MIVFSLQKNNLWNGSGFIAKPGTLELSSLCFAEQQLRIGSGKYKVKIVGSSISGNGIFSIQILLGEKEILSKTICLNSKANTESSFDLELLAPGPYKMKIIRGKESIGRASISLINFFKVIEKIQEVAPIRLKDNAKNSEKTFVVIDYDQLESPSEISSLFLDLKDYQNCFFLLKTSQSFIEKSKDSNFKFFFEWEDLFDYMAICNSKKIIYLESNLNKSIFSKYNCNIGITNPIRLGKRVSNKISGIIF
jgi:hypothetical protein